MLRDLTKVAPGVVRECDGKRAIYTGTAQALIAAGLIEEHQLPGQPGNGRGMCTFDADGQPAGFEPGKGKGKAMDRTGFKQIVAKNRVRGTVYEVRLVLSAERAAAIQAEREDNDARAPLQSEELVPLAPLQSRAWPFPVSFGRHQVEARA